MKTSTKLSHCFITLFFMTMYNSNKVTRVCAKKTRKITSEKWDSTNIPRILFLIYPLFLIQFRVAMYEILVEYEGKKPFSSCSRVVIECWIIYRTPVVPDTPLFKLKRKWMTRWLFSSIDDKCYKFCWNYMKNF